MRDAQDIGPGSLLHIKPRVSSTLQSGLGSEVEKLSMCCCEQLPGVAAGIGVAGVPADQDPRHPLPVELPVDWVLLAEGPVVRGHSLGSLRAGRVVEELSEGDDGVDHRPVLLPAVRLEDVLTCTIDQ